MNDDERKEKEGESAEGVAVETQVPTVEESSSSAPTTEAMPGKSASSGGSFGLALLALIAAVGVGGAGVYGWQQLSAAIGGIERRIETVDASAAQSAERISSFTGIEDRLDNALATFRTEQQDTRRRLDEVSAAVARVQDLVASGERGFYIAEALHLQRLASERLRLAADAEGALAALTATDTILAGLADPRLLPVREQLAIEITALRAVERPDIAGTALRIQQLIVGLDTLPLRPSDESAAPTSAVADDEPAAPWWERALDRVMSEISRHVTIRRQARAGQAGAETALYLRRMVALRLETARVALIRRDGNDYLAAIDAALAMVDDRFEPEAASHLRGEIEGLRDARLRADLPDITGSYGLLSTLAAQAMRTE